MNAERKSKIDDILQKLQAKKYDSQGNKIAVPSKTIYQSLVYFLTEVANNYFIELNEDSVERMPDGDIIITLKDPTNRASLGVVIGESFANFFYIHQRKKHTIGEAKSVKELLSLNKNFEEAMNKFIENIHLAGIMKEVKINNAFVISEKSAGKVIREDYCFA